MQWENRNISINWSSRENSESQKQFLFAALSDESIKREQIHVPPRTSLADLSMNYEFIKIILRNKNTEKSRGE